MDVSATWAVVIAAAVGGLAGIGGGYVQRRWEERNREEQAVRILCVRLLSAPLMLLFDVGWYASPVVRNFMRWRTKYAVETLRRPLRKVMATIADAKSELDLLVDDERVKQTADSLLAASQGFIEVATQESQPEEHSVIAAGSEITRARGDFLEVAKPYLAHQRRNRFARLFHRGRPPR